MSKFTFQERSILASKGYIVLVERGQLITCAYCGERGDYRLEDLKVMAKPAFTQRLLAMFGGRAQA